MLEGYRSVLKQIYSSEAYYQCVKLYLSKVQAAPRENHLKQRWLTAANMRPSNICPPGSLRLAALELLEALCDRRHALPPLLVVMGYHFQVMTRKLSKFNPPSFALPVNEDLPAESGKEIYICKPDWSRGLVEDCGSSRPGLRRSLARYARIYVADPEVPHLNRERAFNFAQIVALR